MKGSSIVAIGLIAVAIAIAWEVVKIVRAHLRMRRHISALKDIKPVTKPDAITKLAALGDPDGAAAKHVRDWEQWRTYVREIACRIGIDPDDLGT